MSNRMAEIEDRIDTLFGTGDTSSETSNENNSTEQTASTEETASNQNTSTEEVSGQSDAQNSTSNNQQPSAQQPNAQQPQTQQGAKTEQTQNKPVPANRQGDLIDPATGNIIARAGTERRFYEAARTARVQLDNVRAELETTKVQLGAFREAAVLPQQLGLIPNEVSNALQFMAHWKKDPVAAAKNVLTELRAMGHNIDDLGGQVDMAALRAMVQDAVAPFRQDRDAQLKQHEVTQQVNAEVNAVFAESPWAANQQSELQTILETDPTLSLREAVLKLETYALRNGFNLDMPLRQQVLDAQNGRKTSAQMPARINNAQIAAPSATSNINSTPRRTSAASADRSTRDIIRESMAEAGINVSNL